VSNLTEHDLRRATVGDAGHIAHILQQSVSANDSTMLEGPVSAADILAMLSSEGLREETWVLTTDGRVAGWGQIRRYSDRAGYRFAAETSLFVHRDYKRLGFGASILARLLHRAPELGYHHIVAKIFADNKASLTLHYKLGFSLVGVQTEIGWKSGAWREVAILEYLTETNDHLAT
jgi:phosphinothricin acetyltransferase